MWPAEDALRAERVTIVPSLRSFFSGTPRILSVTIEGPYLSVVRTKSGKLLAVPSLLRGKEQDAQKQAASVLIGSITCRDAAVDLFDDTVGPPRRKIRMEGIQAMVKDIDAPALANRSAFALTGTVKGSRQDGQLDISGWASIATRDSSVKASLKSIELTGLQPYIAKAGDVRITGGTLDLELVSEVRDKRLKAPGKVTLTDLKLAPAKGLLGTFMGVPRGAVLTLLRDRGGRITLDFVLEGDIDNPRFSLNETLSKKLALSMSESLKVGIGNVARGAGSLGEKGVEAAGDVVRGVGGAVQNILGGGQ
jgi:hypothetical protein